MTEKELNKRYFDWICQLVCNQQYTGDLTYTKLLTELYNTDFQYTIPMDENRAEEGVDLRYRFGYETKCDEQVIAAYIGIRPCSVLEMMAALALYCEEHIMVDPSIGNRTPKWFWEMIRSLGLESMDDLYFNRQYVVDQIQKFMNHQYEANGKGGLFTVNNPKYDMRFVEIWWQMNWYLNDIL